MKNSMHASEHIRKYKIEKGPSITVEILIENDQLIRTHLSPSDHGLEWYVRGFASQQLLNAIDQWFHAYVIGKATPLNFSTTPVQRALLEIPFGMTLSYKELAAKLGNQKAARATGTACGRNKLPLFVPCHRVIASDGSLGGFSSGGVAVKERLLLFEILYHRGTEDTETHREN